MNNRAKLRLVFTALCFAAIVGCTQQQQSPQDLKEQTARETAALKNNAKAVAQGIREGWNRDQAVDVNSATKEQLVSVGLTSSQADRVIDGRPYASTGDLVSKHVLSQAAYDKIASRVTAGK
ncbi:MAG TPA: helix-hairpin-helix domain-containing protein [Candidatus Angelobacter sp.]|nr:helix-hairpin-helix domain-containing protein [Candidatus Angelobacter sp.]